METLARYQVSYQEFKQELDTEMQKTVEGFVKIGFLLNYATETNIVKEGGYDNVNAFAKAEYGIDATQVSRFVNIYRRFGEPGTPKLKSQYMDHGVAKLGIMLTLPDSINEQIGSDYSKADIRIIQGEIKAEQQVSDLEVMMEEKDSVQQSLPEPLRQIMYQLIHDYPSEYELMYKTYAPEEICETLTPNGESAYTVRIPGIGKMMVFMKAEHIVVINIRSNEKNIYEWQQFYDALQEYVQMGSTAIESWENVFNEKWPMTQKADKHNVQQNSKPEPKKEVKKESKVKTPAPKPQPKPAVKVEKTAEEQLPGQDSIMNHPEYLPENLQEEKPEVLTGEVEDVQEYNLEGVKIDASRITSGVSYESDVSNEQQSSDKIAPVQENSTIRGYKAAITRSISHMENLANKEKWDDLIAEAEKTAWRAKQIKAAGGR